MKKIVIILFLAACRNNENRASNSKILYTERVPETKIYERMNDSIDIILTNNKTAYATVILEWPFNNGDSFDLIIGNSIKSFFINDSLIRVINNGEHLIYKRKHFDKAIRDVDSITFTHFKLIKGEYHKNYFIKTLNGIFDFRKNEVRDLISGKYYTFNLDERNILKDFVDFNNLEINEKKKSSISDSVFTYFYTVYSKSKKENISYRDKRFDYLLTNFYMRYHFDAIDFDIMEAKYSNARRQTRQIPR